MAELSEKLFLFSCLLFCLIGKSYASSVLVNCDSAFCRGFTDCVPAQVHCDTNNDTHTGMWMLSPTTCNCCDFCLPLYGKDEFCSLGGPGTGVTIGRCDEGLTCVLNETDGHGYCKRMSSPCHTAQDLYDERLELGQIGALEMRPHCDGKGRYAPYDCVLSNTCFCQSEQGERIFGEVLYMGSETWHNMHCGCSRLHDKIKKSIAPGVPYPVVGPRCTSDGNFNPVQCLDRTCYCVDPVSGEMEEGDRTRINLDEEPVSALACYDPQLDIFPQNTGGPPFNYTTPCFEEMRERTDMIKQSHDDGFIIEFFTSFLECMPDGTYGRIATAMNREKLCVDELGQQIENYKAKPGTPEYDDMDCNCAQTSTVMSSSIEQPVCCTNGNFREVQCRRGMCRCVDTDGRQREQERADVTDLFCYGPDWRTC